MVLQRIGSGFEPSTWRERAAVLLVACVLTTVMTWPMIPHFSSAGRLNNGDGRFSIWNVAWVAHALTSDPANLFNANIFHPHPGTLAYSELNLVAGVLGTPAYLATQSPLAALNGAVAAALVISFVAMWALVRRLSGSSWAGIVAATLFTFAPYVSARTAHIQLLMVFAFPLMLLAFERMRLQPTIGTGAGLGLALGIAAFACGYYGIYSGMVLGLAVILWSDAGRRFWLALAVAGGVTAAVVLPVLMPYFTLRAAAGAASRGWNPEAWRMWSASWRAYAMSGADAHAWWAPYLGRLQQNDPGFEVLFPGMIALILGSAGAWFGWRIGGGTRRWVVFLLLVIVLATWASFGPRAGLYPVIVWAVPGMEMLRVPARFAVLVPLGLAVLSGFAVARIVKGRAWMGIALVMLSTAELRSQWPLDTMGRLPFAYSMLASLPRGAMIEYPFPYKSSVFFEHTKAMLPSAFHWQPLVNGYSDFSPIEFEDIAVPLNGFPDPVSFEMLRERNVRYVVWRLDEYNETARRILESRFPPYAAHLRRLTDDQGVWLYEIVSWPEVPGK